MLNRAGPRWAGEMNGGVVAGAFGRMSAWRDLGFHQIFEPAEVGGDEPLELAAQQARDQPEQAAGVARIDWVRAIAAPSGARRYSSAKRTSPAMPWPTRLRGGS